MFSFIRRSLTYVMGLILPTFMQVISIHQYYNYFDGKMPSIEDRNQLMIPNIANYYTLKCDFHMHTYLSDGIVSPANRVEEAWREGLDAIAITDHLEFSPLNFSGDKNESYKQARKAAEGLDLIIINGCEVTRKTPPGHFNTLFVTDANAVNQKGFLDAIKAACDQGAFIIYNHPKLTCHSESEVWTDIHEKLLKKGWLHGIEVVNRQSYYPHVHDWYIEKSLTPMGNSDLHLPSWMEFSEYQGRHRPMTLVFCESPTAEGIKEALFSRRTAIYYRHGLAGDSRFLEPLFHASVHVQDTLISISGEEQKFIEVRNLSSLPFRLEFIGSAEVDLPDAVVLPPRSTKSIPISVIEKESYWLKSCRLSFQVANCKTARDRKLFTGWQVDIEYIPVPAENRLLAHNYQTAY